MLGKVACKWWKVAIKRGKLPKYFNMIRQVLAIAFCLQVIFTNADEQQPLKGYYSACKDMTRTRGRQLDGAGDIKSTYRSNPDACEAQCRNNAHCMSASLIQPSSWCHQYGSNQRTGPGHLKVEASDHYYFEKNCNSELTCNPESVHGAIILPRGVRKGSVYVKGHYMQADCFRKFGGPQTESVEFTFEYNKCGGNKQDDLYWNKTVVVLNAETPGQMAGYRISCPMRLAGDSNEMRIREPGHAIEDFTYWEDLVGKKEDKIELKLERNAVEGRPEWLKLTISANQGNIGVFPFDCYLTSHMDDTNVTTKEKITAENGCPHDYTKMRAFVPGPNKFEVQALLSSAPQTARRLNVECTVVTCENACPLPSCYGEAENENNTLDLLPKSATRKTATATTGSLLL